MDSLFLDALSCQNRGRPPVWFMRQAGRYLPEYRKLKEKFGLKKMFYNAELIEQITTLPIEILGVDAAILYSDILLVLESLGVSWEIQEGIGPVVTSTTTFSKKSPEECYPFVATAIRNLKKTLSVPLVGFAGAPFTVASYLLEGQGSKDLKKTKQLLFTSPIEFHRLLEEISEAICGFLQLQIDAGVDAIQIFDSWAQVLGRKEFLEFSLPYLQKIQSRFSIPVILFCRGSCFFAKELASLCPAGIGLDWQMPLAEVRKVIPSSIAVQGNLDPSMLLGAKEKIREEAISLLQSMRGDQGFIFNLGHGIYPETPVENVKMLVELIKSQ